MIVPEVCHLDDWVTTTEVINTLVCSSKLFIISGFYVSSVVLVEVIKLVVNVNWSFGRSGDFMEVNLAFLADFTKVIVVVLD